MKRRTPTPGAAVGFAAALALVFLAGTALPSTLEAAGASGESAVRAFYRPLCHQLPWRSFWLDGQPLALCARCTGLYLGGFLGLLAAAFVPAWRRRAPRLPWLAVAVIPTVVDVVAGSIGFAGLPDWPRFFLGVPAGFALGLCLAVGIADLALWLSERNTKPGSTISERSHSSTLEFDARDPRVAAERADGRSS
jgi:uncharacterized membrane protein